VPTIGPEGYDRLLDQVVLISRLRRSPRPAGLHPLAAPERGDLQPVRLVPLTRGAPDWIPAVEQRGEGIFLELREAAVARWAARVAGHPRLEALEGAYRRWSYNRGHTASPSFPIARPHPHPHLQPHAVRQVALECGYSSASLRERVYIGTAGAPTAGYCSPRRPATAREPSAAWSRSATAGTIKRLLDQAFDDALHCSSDPLCAEHVPIDPSAALHGAACHACLFASETSCETNNRWLDRAFLADLTGDGLAFTP